MTTVDVDIDDDVLAYARAEATRREASVGKVLSTMVRAAVPELQLERDPLTGILLLPTRPDSRPVTLEFVNELRDQLL